MTAMPLPDHVFDDMPPEQLQALITKAVKTYAARVDAGTGTSVPPIDTEAVTATDVVVIVTDMIRAMDLNLIDLAMWYRRPTDAFDAVEERDRHD